MKELLILSGKGGTGKTTVAGAFIKLSQAKAYADCDVDAPNLHLITKQAKVPQQKGFYGMPKAFIDASRCLGCGQCEAHCRFDAILRDGAVYKVDDFACEGCGVCEAVCPFNAITMKDFVSGDLFLYRNETVFSTAQLKTGAGNSGKLVSEVKKEMATAAPDAPFTIVDGSPGIGCPVIASLSGADTVLIVAEPTLSGISDMQRVIQTAQHFGTKIAICVNKYDANPQITEQIEQFCAENNHFFAGKIPYDEAAVQAINAGESVIDKDCPAGTALREVYRNLLSVFLWGEQ